MSVVRSARSSLGRWATTAPAAATAPIVLAAAVAAASAAASSRRKLHSSGMRASRKPRFKSIKASDMGLADAATAQQKKKKQQQQERRYPEYTAEELEQLRKRYTAAQFEAIQAGQAAVSPADLVTQGRRRSDPHRPTYVEDYTRLDPRFDIQQQQQPAKKAGGTAGGPREHKWPSRQEWLDELAVKMSAQMSAKTDAQLTRAMVRALRRVRNSHGAHMIDLTEEDLSRLETNPSLLQKYIVEREEAGQGLDGVNNDGGSKEEENEANKDGDNARGGGGGGGKALSVAEAQKLDEAIDAEWKKELERIAELDTKAETTPSAIELLEDGPAGVQRLESAVAPELGKVPGVEGQYAELHGDPEDEGRDALGQYQGVKHVTGLKLSEVRSLYCKVLVTRFVVNQTRIGKVRSCSIIAVAGNGDGRLGIGMAKSVDTLEATSTARVLAIQNMKAIRRYEKRTIYGSSKAKFGGTVVELYSRPPGFGLRVPERLFEMCRAVGLHDMSARMPRARNPMNSVLATYHALMNQIDLDAMARGRSRKLVDTRKVYYGGSVY